jgi:hypothetical protein
LLFLQVGKEVKKVTYDGELTIPALQLLFMEKFSYTSGQLDFPHIYIRDPVANLSYELEDVSEVQNKSVLILNLERKIGSISIPSHGTVSLTIS